MCTVYQGTESEGAYSVPVCRELRCVLCTWVQRVKVCTSVQREKGCPMYHCAECRGVLGTSVQRVKMCTVYLCAEREGVYSVRAE